MPPRQPLDPFTEGPARPNASSQVLRAQPSQQSLRSDTSAASSRARQPRDLFAPALSRRPTSRATPVVTDEILADPDSDEEQAAHRQRQMRKTRQVSPEGKQGRRRVRQSDELDIVNRKPNGEYLLDVSEAWLPQANAPELVEEREAQNESAYYAAVARQYFTSGMAMGGRALKKPEEDPEEQTAAMMAHLRRQALRDLDEERWLVEPLDRYLPRLH
ncbi:hypothetical protein LTR53_002849 [Teratosphaeriaceae sp. CCFEE 6253]|nr:hypothetical protein LTR53_002849 [Teratosphaeriaceae sp. CCFEE 6253]